LAVAIDNTGTGQVNVQGPLTNADPAFVVGGELSIGLASPCIDAGDPAALSESYLGSDIRGRPRPWDVAGHGRDGSGDEIDIGAYEYQ